MHRFQKNLRLPLPGLLLLACALFSAHAECPAVHLNTRADTAAFIRVLESRSGGSIDELCLCSLAESAAGSSALTSQFIRIATEYTAVQGFSLALFYKLAHQGAPSGQAEKMLALWEKRNGPVSGLAGKLERAGNFREEDSLLDAADHCRPLTMDQLMQWAHIRELQEKLSGSAEVYAKAIQATPRSFGPITGKLYQMLEQAPDDSIVAVLGVLRQALAFRGVDTLSMQYWMAEFYRRHGLDSLEQDLLLSIPATTGRLLPRFDESAHILFSRGLFAKAILPARSFFEHSDNRQLKSADADIIYQSYLALHRDDSALAWLLRAGVSGDKRKIDAAVLFQSTGRLKEAESIIATLDRSSFSRDTLELRQKLWVGDSSGAAALLTAPGTHWDRHPDDHLLWTARVLLFRGSVDQLASMLDTLPIVSTGSGAAELLNCRLVLQRFKGEDSWLKEWGRVQYWLFLGKPLVAYERIPPRKYSAELQDALLLCITKKLSEQGDMQTALRIFEQEGDSAASPEYLYGHADQLYKSMNIGKARVLLLKIIRDYPGSVFSEKARVLLAGLPKAG